MEELKKVTQLAWRRLLLSEPGIEGLLYILEKSPVINRGDSHEIIFQAGVVEGWRRCHAEIQALAAAPASAPVDIENH